MTSERPKLLVLASTYPRWHNDTIPGFVHELAKRLTDRFEVTVIAPHAAASLRKESLDGVQIRRFRYAPEKLERLAYEGGIASKIQHNRLYWLLVPLFAIAMLLSCIRELRRNRYAAIHAHWLIPQGIVALVAARLFSGKTMVICTSHGGDLFGFRGVVGRAVKRFVLRRADAITVVSHAMLDEVSLLVAPRRVAVIPMGVDLSERFTPSEATTRDENTLLFVGRLVEKKGVEVLIEAFSQVSQRSPSLRLQIVGDGPERCRLEERVAALGLQERVSFEGSVAQDGLPEYFRKATLFVMPSVRARSGDQEGLGLVQVEAMGCGCPVVSSDLPAVRDVVFHERNGFLVPPGNASALSAAIERLLADRPLRQSLAENAVAHVRACFDWTVSAGRYAEEIIDLVHCPEPETSRNSAP